jgi:lipopolysaccharide transport system permease protein
MKNIVIIEPRGRDSRYWRELWDYRELFRVLAVRDIAVRYKQTAIGVAWALIPPFLTMVVFTIIFGRLAGFPSEGGTPYTIMVLAGILPWTFFSNGLDEASNSPVRNSNLISKVYFPRLIIPIAAVVVALVDFLISFAILITLMVWYQFVPNWQVMFLPGLVALAILACIGPALWLAELNVRYRDFRYVIPFLLQFGLYVSPVGFSSAVVPERWRLVYSLNPMAGIIDGFRWSILGSPLYLPGFLLSLATIFFFLWFGLRRFRRMEKSFADLI